MRHRQGGFALVELALALPLLLTITIGSISVGRIVWAERVVQTLAGDAARVASLGATADDATARASRRATELASDASLDPARLQVTIDTHDFRRGGTVAVEARYEVVPIALLGNLTRATSWQVGGEVRMPVDRYRSGVRDP